MRVFLRRLHYTVLPPTCLLCGAPGQPLRDLCGGCEDDLLRPAFPCPRCGLPKGADIDGSCPRCLRRAPPWDGLLAAFEYAPPLDQLIFRLKYQCRLDAARLLGELLAEYLAAVGRARPDCLVPVPLHVGRLADRGFNQATELARPIACALDLPIVVAGITRVRATVAQSGLNARMRRRNMRNAFAAGSSVQGRRVAIIDDVVTTGSTVAALSRALRRAGARRIDVWAVARANPQP